MSQLRMIDISADQHPTDTAIDWPQVVAAGYAAVMIKATEGTDYVNPWLGDDAHGAHLAGLLVGYYHYRHPGEDDPDGEARFALAHIDGLPRDLGLAQDLEITEGESWKALKTQAITFHNVARRVVDHSPLYVNDYFLDNLPGAPFGERLWLAQTDRPRRVCWAWQETSPGVIPGVPGLVDVGWMHPLT